MARNKRKSGKLVYTTGEAAEICHLSQQTIIRCFDNGTLKGFRVPGSRFRRIPRESLVEFIRYHNIPVDLPDENKIRVLIVNDKSNRAMAFNDILSRDDRFIVETASTGYEAGLKTKKIIPDVLMLDYMMPDINGGEICQTVRSSPDLQNTKVLLASHVVDHDKIEKLLDAGADDFFSEPFDAEEAANKIVCIAGK